MDAPGTIAFVGGGPSAHVGAIALARRTVVHHFSKRPCYHIGQTLTCSQLHGDRAVLLDDAAAAFPPIGQG